MTLGSQLMNWLLGFSLEEEAREEAQVPLTNDKVVTIRDLKRRRLGMGRFALRELSKQS